MEYEEFTVEIASDGAGGFRATILAASQSRAVAELAPPFTAEQVEGILARLEAHLRRQAHHAAGREIDLVEGEEPRAPFDLREELGVPLSECLFSPRIATRLQRALGRLDTAQADGVDRGLRLRLVFGGPEGEDRSGGFVGALGPLAALPWELIWEPGSGDFLSRSRYHALVRSLDVPRPIRNLGVKPPLRVLVVDASPAELSHLELPEEKSRIKDALQRKEVAEIELLEGASFEDTIATLREGKFHVLHFMGHGGFDREAGESHLIFENPEDGSAQRIPARLLAQEVKDLKTLRLVFLNSCSSAALPRLEGQDPFSGVAVALLAAGVPAVLAMQFPISDRAAIEFAQEFYTVLREGELLETATAEGRQAIARTSEEWATPVLYLRPPEGRLLDRKGEPSLLKIGIRSFIDDPRRPERGFWARGLKSTTDRLLSLESYFEGRFIRSPELWNEVVFPRLARFLEPVARDERPVLIHLPAHCTLAFATGYYLEAKCGRPVSVRQLGIRGFEVWRFDLGEIPEGDLWEFEEEPRDPDARDVVAAVSLSRSVLPKVREYLDREGLAVRRILHASLPGVGQPESGGVGQAGIASGAHAWQLAEALSRRIEARSAEEDLGVLHLFAAGPNGFLLFLGQLARPWGRVRLYEFDFEKGKHGSYEPSMDLPPAPQPGRRQKGAASD